MSRPIRARPGRCAYRRYSPAWLRCDGPKLGMRIPSCYALHRNWNNLVMLGKNDCGLRSQTASSHGPAKYYAQCQPDNSKKDCRQHVSQKMRTQSNTAEPYQEDQAYCAANGQQSPM